MVLVTGVVVTTAPPASATPTWSVTPSPSPPGPAYGNLAGVACVSETNCFAVGSYAAGSTEKTSVERWDGTSWSILPSPNPSGATASALSGVACLSETRCYAVGHYVDGSIIKSLVERWNGTSWLILPSPNPTGALNTFLSGVSCPIAGSCYAVGNYATNSSYNTLVEQWNGTSWSIVASPNPSDSTSSLSGVACLSASRCYAVGYSSTGSNSQALVERWNGTSWSILPSPSGISGGLSGVSCPVAGSCYAVGSYFNGSTIQTLVERWNGTSWSIVASPNPSGATSSGLGGVACASSTSCFAVGGSAGNALVERWNGTSWSIVAIPNLNPSGATYSGLSGVACPKTASCDAVGSYYSTGSNLLALVEVWNGTSWSLAAPPTGSSQSQLTQVSCPSATSCYAVGHSFNGSTDKTLVERWNGTSWSILPSPKPSGANFVVLSSVRCPSTTSCYAVGSYVASGTTKTLVERWNGTSWSIVASPNPSGATASVLSAVACPSTTSCYAVGNSFDGSTVKTLVERWNGTTWSIVASPNPSDANFAVLNGVACPTATSCYAVGNYRGVSKATLVERWNGTSWSIVTSPNPSGATATFLSGVSCPSTTSCYAVGYADVGNPEEGPSYKTVVERWNGTSWSIVASPNPSSANFAVLNGVSCSSTTGCYAVGYSFDSSYKTLVERWNGTSWSIVTSPNPSGATGSVLSGVSCPTATSCYAVGDYQAHAGNSTLIERYA